MYSNFLKTGGINRGNRDRNFDLCDQNAVTLMSYNIFYISQFISDPPTAQDFEKLYVNKVQFTVSLEWHLNIGKWKTLHTGNFRN